MSTARPYRYTRTRASGKNIACRPRSAPRKRQQHAAAQVELELERAAAAAAATTGQQAAQLDETRRRRRAQRRRRALPRCHGDFVINPLAPAVEAGRAQPLVRAERLHRRPRRFEAAHHLAPARQVQPPAFHSAHRIPLVSLHMRALFEAAALGGRTPRAYRLRPHTPSPATWPRSRTSHAGHPPGVYRWPG